MEELIKTYIKFMEDFLNKYENDSEYKKVISGQGNSEESNLEKNQSRSEMKNTIDNMIKTHLIQISFFQHERLVHLIVTVIFALLEVFSLMLVVIGHNIPSIFLCIAVLILLVPYIRHYYILENDTQQMYEQYDRLLNISSKIDKKLSKESDFWSYRHDK